MQTKYMFQQLKAKEPLFGDWRLAGDYRNAYLGGGAFGYVFLLAKEDWTGHYLSALKYIPVQTRLDSNIRKNLRQAGVVTEQEMMDCLELNARKQAEEIQILYGLQGHDNIVAYQDHSIHVNRGQDVFEMEILLRMEYLPDSLTKLLENGPLPWEQAIQIARGIANGLAAAHNQGIIHRDLKPDNILLTANRQPKIVDFGTAKLFNATVGRGLQTYTGTPLYMAPEVYDLRLSPDKSYGHWVDIYGWGLLLYEMLTGSLPFLAEEKGNEEACLKNRLSGQAFPGIDRNDVPPEVDKVIAKACAYRPEDRYSSADELVNILAGLGDSVRHVGKMQATTGKSTVGCRAASDIRETALLGGHLGIVRTVAFSVDGSYLLSASDDTTLRIWNVKNDRKSRIVRGHIDGVKAAAFCLDGQTFASGGQGGSIKLWDTVSGREKCTIRGHRTAVLAMAWLEDGHTLVSGSKDAVIRLWDSAAGKETAVIPVPLSGITVMAFSAAGRFVAAAAADGTVILWDLNARQQLREWKQGGGKPETIAFSPDGSLLAVGDGQQAVLWDVNSGEERYRLRGHSGAVTAVAFSPDGRFLVTGSIDKKLKLWDLTTEREQAVFAGCAQAVTCVAFAPDTCTLAIGSRDYTIRIAECGS